VDPKVASPYLVRIVVDPSFGERLTGLPEGEPVWVIESVLNTPVAHRLWTERPKDYRDGITTFTAASGSSAEAELIRILETVDEHHGEYSAGPPYSLLDVIGCSPSEQVQSALVQFEFAVTEQTSDGFRAARQVI
jgi:hypothetical protein